MLKDAYDLSFYEFDEERDPKVYGVLLCDVVHGRPPMKPTYMGIGWYWYYHGVRYGAARLCLPTTHGWDSRFVNGYPYITAIRTTAEEAKAREPIFRERIKPFLEDFDGVWDPLKADLLKTYKAARESRGLKEWDDIKKLSNDELLSFFLDFAYVINRKEGEVHFYMLMAAYYISGSVPGDVAVKVRHRGRDRPQISQVNVGFRVYGRKFYSGALAARQEGGGAWAWSKLFKTTEDADVLEKLNATRRGESGPRHTMNFCWSTGGGQTGSMPMTSRHGSRSRVWGFPG